jgi:hypothetical protein
VIIEIEGQSFEVQPDRELKKDVPEDVMKEFVKSRYESLGEGEYVQFVGRKHRMLKISRAN